MTSGMKYGRENVETKYVLSKSAGGWFYGPDGTTTELSVCKNKGQVSCKPNNANQKTQCHREAEGRQQVCERNPQRKSISCLILRAWSQSCRR